MAARDCPLPREIQVSISDDLLLTETACVVSATKEINHILRKFPGARAAKQHISLEVVREAGRQGIALQFG